VGSFINVCVYRIPLERSIMHPGSHCSACGAPIPWKNNIPIISWIILRGRAACCGTRIDARYCVVEAGMAFLYLAIWLKYGHTDPVEAVIYAIMLGGLTTACLIDLDHYIIPDRFSLGGCVAGFIACAIHPALMWEKTALQGFSWSLAGAMAGALTLLAIAWIGTALTFILPLSSLIGSILGLALIFWQRGAWGTRIPYGPFLGLAAILWLFGGSDFMYAYWNHVAHLWNMSTAPTVMPPEQ
jgi:leader peptidase (prepilin peptidase)/N-methyltransferase